MLYLILKSNGRIYSNPVPYDGATHYVPELFSTTHHAHDAAIARGLAGYRLVAMQQPRAGQQFVA